MTKRLAQRIDRRKRSHQADQDESRIPISRETAGIPNVRTKQIEEIAALRSSDAWRAEPLSRSFSSQAG
jgi:hypothetical protein